jgi:cell wall-associated NlpC family hydrolase
MGAVVALQNADGLAVEPGQTTTCQLSIANTGTIVEQFNIMFLGDVEAWTTADPPVVSLFPGAQQTVTVTFAPPREHTVTSGLVHFAVKVIPSNEPDESVTEEGSINVGVFNDVGAELVPRVVVGRLTARQKLAVDSRGNTAIPVEISAVDPSDALKFRIRPDRLTAAPGQAHFARLRIAPRQRMWRGREQQKPYQVMVAAEGEQPVVLNGAVNQKPVIPKWVFAAAAIIAAALLLWFFLIKPAVHSTAVNANKSALAAQQAQTANLQKQLSATQNQTSNNAAAIAVINGHPTTTTTTVPKKKPAPTTTTTTTKPSTVTTQPPPVTLPSDGTLSVVASPGSSQTASAGAVGTGTTIQVSDLVIENVSGSAGTARVERIVNGQTQVLLVENLANLNGQEYHFNTPIMFTHKQQLQLEVDCQPNQTACSVNLYYTGPITEPQSVTTTTAP